MCICRSSVICLVLSKVSYDADIRLSLLVLCAPVSVCPCLGNRSATLRLILVYLERYSLYQSLLCIKFEAQ